jgi:hypothetical protein
MRRFVLALILTLSAVAGLSAQAKLLYVHDELNEQSKPYVARFEAALAARGFAFDEATAAQARTMDLSKYRAVLIHGMVMAFNSKSPVRDWLKAGPALAGKPVYLFVTANRWMLDKLDRQLKELLAKYGSAPVDAVSAATKAMDAEAKDAAVRGFVARLK